MTDTTRNHGRQEYRRALALRMARSHVGGGAACVERTVRTILRDCRITPDPNGGQGGCVCCTRWIPRPSVSDCVSRQLASRIPDRTEASIRAARWPARSPQSSTHSDSHDATQQGTRQQMTQLHFGVLSSPLLGVSEAFASSILRAMCIAVVSPGVTLQSAGGGVARRSAHLPRTWPRCEHGAPKRRGNFHGRRRGPFTHHSVFYHRSRISPGG